MKISFKYAQSLLDQAIAFWTRGSFSHCVLVFNDDMRQYIPPNIVHLGDTSGSLTFSAQSGSPLHGCGFVNIDFTSKLKDGSPAWWVVDMPCTRVQELTMLRMAVHENGKG